MSNYNKPYLTYEQQLAQLKERGLIVSDDARAIECLRRLGYYRLSAYWLPFRELKPDVRAGKLFGYARAETFRPDSTFSSAVDLYVFDKMLRMLVLDAVERVEIGIRVGIAYLLGARDPFAHSNPAQLHGNFTKRSNPRTGKTYFDEWQEKLESLTSRSKEEFLRHFEAKYGRPLPIWVVVELWDFGLLSRFYQGMQAADKEAIAKSYGIPNFSLLETWLRSINFVRNVAAHHNRLWNRNLIDQPKPPQRGDTPLLEHLIGDTHALARVYSVLAILNFLLLQIHPRSTWPNRLAYLIDRLPKAKPLTEADLGFPSNWRSLPLWKSKGDGGTSLAATLEKDVS